MTASPDNKKTALRIVRQEKSPLLKIIPFSHSRTEKKQHVDKTPPFEQWKMPDQPASYIKGPRYEYF